MRLESFDPQDSSQFLQPTVQDDIALNEAREQGYLDRFDMSSGLFNPS